MFRRWAAPVAWAALISVFSLVPMGGVAVPVVSHADKLVHLAMYAMLAALVNHSARWPCLTCAVSVTAGCGLLGGAIELLQSLVPGRWPDVWDAVANTAGAAIGSWAYIRWRLGKLERETE